MKVKNKYILLKKSIYKKIISYNFSESFGVSKKKDNNRIGIIKFYDDKTINHVVKNSIDKHFKKLLELLASIDESDSDPSDGLLFCLDEVAKFKRELNNKYEKFLKKSQKEIIDKKIKLIEKEIKDKLLAYQMICAKDYKLDLDNKIEEKGHSR